MFTKNQYRGKELPKKGGTETVCRFNGARGGGGVGKKGGGGFFWGGGGGGGGGLIPQCTP